MYCCEQTVCASAANRVGWWIVAKSPLPWASSISPLPNKNPNLSVPPISVLIFTLIIFLFSLCIFFPWAESRPLFFFSSQIPFAHYHSVIFQFFPFPGLTRLWCLHFSSTNLVWSCFCCDNNKTIIDGQTQACLHIYAFDVSGHL